MNNELEYGAVFVFQGRHKGRVLYYDDDGAPRTAICYVGHPIDFVGTHNIPIRFLRVPTIDDLLKRHEEIGRQLAKFAIDDEWDISPDNIHSLWSEKSLINDILYERRMFGKFTQLSERSVIFLCHSSSDKGAVRMVHDDLRRLGQECWLDENKIKVGDSIVSRISDGLVEAHTMIAFLSPSSVESIWARKEWQSFLARQLSGSKLKILPVLLKDCKIPAILSDLKYADFRESYYEGFTEIYNALK
jgi:TIR domain